MAWPFGIADQAVYAYLMNAAAAASLSQYPYASTALPPNAIPPPPPPPPPTHPPPPPHPAPGFSYFASVGLHHRAAASVYHHPPQQHPLRSSATILGDGIPNLPATFLRSSGGGGPYETPQGQASLPFASTGNVCPGPNNNPLSRDSRGVTTGRSSASSHHRGHHVTEMCPTAVTGEPCTCGRYMVGSSLSGHHLSVTSAAKTTYSMTSPKGELNNASASASALFQPYKTDAETV